MKRTFVSAAAIAVSAAALAACGPDEIDISAHEVGSVIGHHAEEIHIDPGKIAGQWHLAGPGSVRRAVGSLRNSFTWVLITDDLARTHEPFEVVRKALVEAACTSALNDDYTQEGYETNLADSLRGKVLPSNMPSELVLEGTVSQLAQVMKSDPSRADLAIGCATWKAASLLHG